MAVNYTKIDDLTQISRPAATDMVLVARPGSGGYTTYSCLFKTLSNAISCDVKN